MKTKREVKKFIDYMFDGLKVPRIPVHVHWYYPAISTESGFGFGVLVVVDGKAKEVHIAGKKLGKKQIITTIAHELAHCTQLAEGDDSSDCELAAEIFADTIQDIWASRRKKRRSGHTAQG